jgi:hypothetical protein
MPHTNTGRKYYLFLIPNLIQFLFSKFTAFTNTERKINKIYILTLVAPIRVVTQNRLLIQHQLLKTISASSRAHTPLNHLTV